MQIIVLSSQSAQVPIHSSGHMMQDTDPYNDQMGYILLQSDT